MDSALANPAGSPASGLEALHERQGRSSSTAIPTAAASATSQRFPLLVHCHLRWDFVWQRPQQLFSRLAAHHAVLFIEDPLPGEGEARLELSEPYPNVVRMLPRLPQAEPLDVDAQWRLLLPLMERALTTHALLKGRFERPVQWFYSPMSAAVLLGRFGARGTVYDCMDELANFRFAPADIAERERFLLARADVVFTGGYQLYQEKSRHHDTVHFHGCGVDAAHFGRARLASTVVPGAVADLPGPVLGYVGVIDERLDYDLIEALARRFPQASVVMAGPVVKVDPASLPKLPNIHWLGQQAYEQLPALVKGFDVCLMPFALNDATRYINPTKTLEYMATGKPVVSTAVADVVRNFTPVVDVARSVDGFLDAVARAVVAPDSALLREGIARASAASWESTVASMRGQLLDAVLPVRTARGNAA